MRPTMAWMLTGLLSVLPIQGQVKAQTLDIYFIDTEGGQATLYVTPSGESMLVDTGNRGERDAGRILEVLDVAGVDRIDHLWLTHFHSDHYGGLEALSQQIDIEHYYDHGPPPEEDQAMMDDINSHYAEIHSGVQRTIVAPGDRVDLGQVDVLVVASDTEVLEEPIAGAPGVSRPAPACESFQPKDLSDLTDPDNDYSAGFVMSYGTFRTINLGDLTWNYEYELMCPNKVGTVDLYLTSHHGLDRSGSAALVHGLQPRVAVMNNGTRKGGSVDAIRVLRTSPGLEDVWQLHWSHHGGIEYNSPGVLIANLDAPETLAAVVNPGGAETDPTGAPGGEPPDAREARAAAANHSPAHYIKVSAQSDGSFTVTNSRNGFNKTYGARDN